MSFQSTKSSIYPGGEQEHDGLLHAQVLLHLPARVEQGEGRVSSMQGKVL